MSLTTSVLTNSLTYNRKLNCYLSISKKKHANVYYYILLYVHTFLRLKAQLKNLIGLLRPNEH